MAKKVRKSIYRWYACCATGTIRKIKTTDIKPGNPIWHMGDTQSSFKESVLFLESAIQEDVLHYTEQLSEATNWLRKDKEILEKVKNMKKSKEFKLKSKV